jgi:WD40 repeat protein
MQLSSRLFALALLIMPSASVESQNPLPTADDVKALEKKFEVERAAAAGQKFPAHSLELSDQLAQRGHTALERQSLREAQRLYREARWQLPYLPPDLPDGVSRVFGNTRMRHGDWVLEVAFNPEGTLLASASKDGTVKIWDLGNGREVRTYRRQQYVRCVAWSPDGKLIASAGGSSENSTPGEFEIHLWNPEDGKLVHALKGHTTRVNSVAFRNDGKALVSGSDDKTIRIWDVEKGTELQIVNPPQQRVATINQAIYSPNGKLIASVNNDGQLQVWKPDATPPQQKILFGLGAHSGGAYQVVFSQDMQAIFTCGGDKIAWQHGGTDPEGHSISGTGARQKNFDISGGGHAGVITCLALSPDGKTLVTGSKDRSIRVWDVNSAKVVRILQGHADEITSVVFSNDGAQLASSSKDQSIRIWNLSSSDDHRNFVGHDGILWSAVFSNDGKLFASGGADKKIVIRDTATGEVLRTIPAHALAVTALAFNRNGTRLASSGGDQLVKLWNVKTGELIKEFKGHTSAVMALAYSDDDKLILSGGADKIARLWDVEKGTTVQVFPDVRSPISSVAIRKDGRQALIGCADGTLHVYNTAAAPTETGFVIAHLSGVGGLAYSPDGSRVATCGGDKLVKLWKLPDSGATARLNDPKGQEPGRAVMPMGENGTPVLLAELKGHSNPVSSVAFSNDGRLLASGGGDMLVKVWDVQNGTELRSLRGHSDWVSSVAFGPDSRFILSASVDKSVKIWELSNEETTPPIGHTRALKTLAVSEDGKLLASGSEDRTIKVWDTATAQELYTLAEHTNDVTALAFDPKSNRLVSGGDDGKLRIWDLKERKVIQTIDCDRVPVIVFSAAGDKILAWFWRRGSGSTAQVFDANGKPIHSVVDKERAVNCLTFSADGELVAMGAEDGSVAVWNIDKNERLGSNMTVYEKTKMVDLVFTPDKKKLITGDEAGEIKIWDLAKREVIKTIQAQNNGLSAIAMSPDGKRFVTVGGKNELRLWNVENGEQIKEWELITPVRNLAFSADGKKLFTANGDTTLYQIDLP